MPKNKKKWIDSKNCETFRLLHRSQKDPLVADDVVGEHVLQPVEKKNVGEHIKYGIYYDDDYNYLQHLRSLNEVTELESVERTIIRAPKGKANLPSTLFETGGIELNVGLLNQAALPGSTLELDEEIVAALEGDLDYADELEDDFVLKANGGELPSSHPPEPVRTLCRSKENDNSNWEPYGDDEYSYSDSQDESDEGEEMTCNIASSRIIDEKFDHLCEEGEFCEDDEEIEGNLLEPDSYRMKELVDECRNNGTDLVLEKDEVARRYAFIDDPDEECASLDRISMECPNAKKAKWDCESVLSAYSNIYNHPTVIKESRRQRLCNRAAGASSEPQQAAEVMDCGSVGIVDSVCSSARRRRDETAEEKKQRKKAIKEARAERRAEKKANKRAFAETRRKKAALAVNAHLKAIHIS
uniref:Protein LTV1 homolog n=1 Tax=Parascaris univalens TaxID=6257 RepID=A0A915B0T7_PARUN